jgi:hypothetical protein
VTRPARWWVLSPLDRLERADRDSTVIAALRAVLLRHQPPATGAAKTPEQAVEIAEVLTVAAQDPSRRKPMDTDRAPP